MSTAPRSYTQEELFSKSSSDEISRELYMDNLPASMTQFKFEQMFKNYGTLEKCVFRQHQTSTRTGYGFVTFETRDQAQAAQRALSGIFVDGHNVRVSFAKKLQELVSDKNLYVCDLPLAMTRQGLENLFGTYGVIKDCRVLTDSKTRTSRGVGFIHFEKSSSAKQALETLNGSVPPKGDKPVLIRYARENKRSRGGGSSGFGRGRGGGRGGYGPDRRGGRGMMSRFTPMGGPPRGMMGSGMMGPGGFGPARGAFNGGFGGGPAGGWGGDAFGAAGGFGGRGGFGARGGMRGRGGFGGSRGRGFGARGGRGGGGRSSGQPISSRNIYVSQFPAHWDEQMLRQLFSGFGMIEACNVTTAPGANSRIRTAYLEQPSRGVGFIHFSTHEAASAAVQEMNDTSPHDSQLQISVRFANRGGNMAQSDRTCKFYLEGRCRKGGECDFVHESPSSFGNGFPGPGGGGGFGGGMGGGFGGPAPGPPGGGFGDPSAGYGGGGFGQASFGGYQGAPANSMYGGPQSGGFGNPSASNGGQTYF